jgi:hypothetical protein
MGQGGGLRLLIGHGQGIDQVLILLPEKATATARQWLDDAGTLWY